MIEIEFVDDGGTVEPAPEVTHRHLSLDVRSDAPRWPVVVAITGWLLAAVILVIAPFTSAIVVVDRFHGFERARQAVNGWGRDPLLQGHVNSFAFGLALCVCAALFVLAAGLCVRFDTADIRRESARRERWASRTWVAAPSVFLGVALSIGIWLHSYVDRLNSAIAGAGIAFPPHETQSVEMGPGGWLIAAALPIAISAAALSGYGAALPRPAEPSPAEPSPDEPLPDK